MVRTLLSLQMLSFSRSFNVFTGRRSCGSDVETNEKAGGFAVLAKVEAARSTVMPFVTILK